MIEKNKDYYKAKVKKLKAENKALKKDNSTLQWVAGVGWGVVMILLFLIALKCL